MIRLFTTIGTLPARCLTAAGSGAVRRGGLVGRWLAAPLLLLLLAAAPAAAFDIDNTATVVYVYGGNNLNQNSNLVRVTVAPPPSVATAEFLRLTPDPLGTTLPGTEYSDSDPPGVFTPILPSPGPGNLGTAVSYDEGELVVLRVTDADRNLDPLALDTLLVRLSVAMTGDDELLRLTETGFDTGIFEGFIPAGTVAATDYNGYLSAPATSQVDLAYDDGGTPLNLSAPVLATSSGGSLWLQLSADRSLVAPGDIVTWSLTVENIDAVSAVGVTVSQQLPAGFRYRPGTAVIGGAPSADPTVSADGNSLTFAAGDLLPGASVVIDFRTTVGAVDPGAYPSTAIARAVSGQVSNPADESVRVRDELGNGKGIIAGRVLSGCDGKGVEGVRIYLEDGTYVITDKRGRYHVEGVNPGTHVVQLDPVTLPDGYEPVLCEDHNRFAGNPSSRFVELRPGSLWRADFTLSDRPINGEVAITLNNTYTIGSAATYTVSLSGKDIPFSGRRLEIELPPEAEYLPASTLLNDQLFSEPTLRGRTLSYDLPDRSGSWSDTLVFRSFIDQNSETGHMPARARLHFDTPAHRAVVTPDAESTLVWISRSERAEVKELILRPHFATLEAVLSTKDLEEIEAAVEELKSLDLIMIYIVGHTDARRIRWREGIPYRDNFELSEARAEAVAVELQKRLNLAPEQTVVIGMGAAEPIADNTTVAGMALNRRTELQVLHRIVVDPEMEKVEANGGPQRFLKTSPEKASGDTGGPSAVEMGILSPLRDSHIAHPVESIRIRLPAGLTPELSYDGTLVPAEKIGFRLNEPATNSQVLTYIGIDLGEPGEHHLRLRGIGPFGNVRFEESATIVRTGAVHRIEVVDQERNVADGRTPVRLRLNFYDTAGNLIRGKVKLEQRGGVLIPLAAEKSRLPGAPETGMVWFDATGTARFEPVSKAGSYRLVLGIGERQEAVDIYVSPEQRDWILVGLAEGTAGYSEISGNIQPLDPSAPEEDYYDDGRVAFFAKGQVRGDWLLTLAYDSGKESLKDRSLHQVIDPGSYYTVYGDTAEQGYEAASAEKLYLRIERERFIALFGDIDTGMNVTELSRYSRSLTGIRSEWSGRNFGYTAFGSETAQNFVRDEIRGDGTSGLYRLSRNDIVVNSEKITLETRDRFHSERIVDRRELQRHLDYDIDYAAGTLYFKEPVRSRDQGFNPVFIVAAYESTARGKEDYTWGGRAYSRLLNDDIEIGASIVHEGQNAVESDLYGVDATIRVSERTTLSGEWATSERNDPSGRTDGDAWLAEIEHRTDSYDVSAYVREQDAGFGLGQQNAGESGTRKYGADLLYRLNRQFDVTAEAYRQENLTTDLERSVEEAALNYRSRRYTLTAGLRHAEDEPAAGAKETSDQLTFGADYHVTEKLDLTLRHEQSVNDNENRDYPTRTLAGARYKLNRSVSLFAEQEITAGDSADTADTRIGLSATPWDGTQVRSSVEQNLGEAGRRVFGNLGLLQTWQVTPKLALNVSLDRSELLSGQNQPSFHPDQPPASGSSEDFTVISAGLSWREADRILDTRAEYRTSDSEERWGLFAGSIVEPETSLGLSLHGSYFNTDRADQSSSREADLSFGLAWRPDDRSWIVLNRLDLVTREDASATAKTTHWKVVERINAFWRADTKNRLSFRFGTRYASDRYDNIDISGTTWLFGTEWRHDIGPKTDIGLHGSVLQVQALGQALYHSGVSVGYSPAKNFWISLGYNVNGFRDEDFSQADHTAQGPFVRFRVKFDQGSVGDALKWLRNN